MLASVYRFIECFGEKSGAVWPSIRVELKRAASLLPLLVADTRRAWSSRVYASDAEGTNNVDFGGMGVVYKDAGADVARQVGRISEKWRYDCEEFVAARRSALDEEERFLHEQIVSGVRAPFPSWLPGQRGRGSSRG